MSRHSPEIRLRPVTEADLGMFHRFVVEPGLIGLDWPGFRDPKAVQRRFDTDSYLGEDNGRLMVDVAPASHRPAMPPGKPPVQSAVPRRVLAQHLRDLRRQAGLTVKLAASLLEWSEPKLWRN